MDTVEVKADDGSTAVLRNELSKPRVFEQGPEGTKGVSLTLDIKQLNKTPKSNPIANQELATAQPTETEGTRETRLTQPIYVITTKDAKPDICTRDSDPFKAERVA